MAYLPRDGAEGPQMQIFWNSMNVLSLKPGRVSAMLSLYLCAWSVRGVEAVEIGLFACGSGGCTTRFIDTHSGGGAAGLGGRLRLRGVGIFGASIRDLCSRTWLFLPI